MKKTIKKITGKIAMILIILMLASSLTSCFTIWAFTEASDAMAGLLVFPIPLLPALDIVTSPIQLIIFLVELDKSKELKAKVEKADGMDTFSTDKELIPRSKLISLSDKIKALPEEEISYFTNTIDSLSEAEIASILNAINSLSEEEIASSVDILSSVSDETLVTVINNSRFSEFRF